MGASTTFMGNEFQSLMFFGRKEEPLYWILVVSGVRCLSWVLVDVMGGGPVWLSGWSNVQGHFGFCRASTVYKSGVVLTCQDEGEAVGSSWAILTPFWVTNIMKNRPNTFKSSE